MSGFSRLLEQIKRRWYAFAALLAIIALVIAWRQPWRMLATPAPTPTLIASIATNTPAQIPDRVALPPDAPPPTRPPVAASLTATPLPSATPALRPVGSLIYLGRIDGVTGIVAANSDGGERRLIAPGVYTALVWSPDGARFAALGGDGHEQIALFAADGRALARFPLRPYTRCDPRWSPDSRFLVCIPLYPFQGDDRTTVVIADEAGLREALVPPVVRTSFLGWPGPGTLGLLALPEEWPYAASEVWTIELASGEVRRLIQGDYSPLGWSADGKSLLALGGRQPRGGERQPGEQIFTELIAVDAATGDRRTVERAERLARIVPVPNMRPGTRYWFSFGSLSPTGGQIALWIARDPPPGSPIAADFATDPTLAILILRDTGDLATITAVSRNATIGVNQTWSPNGLRLAVARPGGPGYLTLAITSTIAAGNTTHRMDSSGETGVAWSSDSRWFAYTAPQGLAVAGVDLPEATIIDPEGRAPAWRPTTR